MIVEEEEAWLLCLCNESFLESSLLYYLFSLNSLCSESINKTCIDTPESRDSFKHSVYSTNALEDITVNEIDIGKDTIKDHNDILVLAMPPSLELDCEEVKVESSE